MDESHRNYAKWKMLYTKENRVHDSFYMKFLRQTKPMWSEKSQGSGYWRGRGATNVLYLSVINRWTQYVNKVIKPFSYDLCTSRSTHLKFIQWGKMLMTERQCQKEAVDHTLQIPWGTAEWGGLGSWLWGDRTKEMSWPTKGERHSDLAGDSVPSKLLPSSF